MKRNKLFLTLGLLFVFFVAAGAGVQENRPTDTIKMGVGTSTDDKDFIFDTGDGASNPRVRVDGTLKTFDLNKATTIGGDLTVDGNNVSFGDGAAGDKVLEADKGLGGSNPKMRWNEASDVWEFSNDGTNFRAIGSGGGGGGINLLQDFNSDFEAGDPPNDYSFTGGAFVAETVSPGFGDQSGSWDASATGQFLRSTAVAVPEGLKGRSCSARFQYNWAGSAGDLIARVEDSSDVLIVEQDLDVTSGWAEAALFFSCPASGDMRIELESTADAALILVDNYELGQIGFQNLIGSNTFEDKILSSDITSSGVMADLTYTNLEVGKSYTINAIFQAQTQPADDDVSVTIDNGGTTLAELKNNTDSGASGYILSTGVPITFQATSTTLTFTVNSAGVNSFIQGDGTKSETYVTLIKRNDINGTAQENLTLQTSSFYAQGYFQKGGSDLNVPATASTGFEELTDPGMTMTAVEGSPSVACSGTNPDSGSTCSAGDESLGFAINLPTAGKYQVCWDISAAINTINVAASEAPFIRMKPVMTQNASQAILIDSEIVAFPFGEAASNASSVYRGHSRICGWFNVDSPGKKTFRLFADWGVPTVTTIAMQANSAIGTRISFFIKKDSESAVQAVFNNVTALDERAVGDGGAPGEYVIASAHITFPGGVPTVQTQSTSAAGLPMIDTISDGGVGNSTLNFNVGFFNDIPHCVCACGETVGSATTCLPFGTAVNSKQVRTRDISGTFEDEEFEIICYGRVAN